LKDLYNRARVFEVNRDDVETAGRVVEMMSHHVLRCQPDDSLLLVPRDRFGRPAEGAAVAGLNFDKHQRRSVARDDVQFATATPMPPGNNCVPAALELAA